MAAIVEELRLSDKFSAAFTRYLNLGSQAAKTSNLAASATKNYESVANSLDRRIIRLNAEFETCVQRQEAMVAAGKQNTEEFAALDAKAEKLGNTIRELTARYAAVQDQAEQAAKAQENTSKKFRAGAESSNSLLSKLKQLAGAYVGIQGVKTLVNMSDTMSQITARLNMINDGQQTTAELNEMIYESAMRSRGAYADTANFVAQLGTLAGDAFNSNSELIAFAEQINKQMKLSGTNSQEASGAMLQLQQAMSSGVLRGEELNSILEQTPMIAQTIADYMGVSTGKMRELASEGLVTADVVKNAILSAARETNAQFEQLPLTWSDVWTQMGNIAIKMLDPVLDGINWLANNIDTKLNWVADNFEGIAAILAGLLAGLGVAAVSAGGKMVASALSSIKAWAMANWPILLVTAAVAALIYMALKAGVTFEEIGGVIGGVFGTLYAFVMNQVIVPAQNAFAAFANFLGNVFNDPVAAIKILLLDMALTVLGHIKTVAHGIEDLINKIPGVSVDLTSGIDNLYDKVTEAKNKIKDESDWKEYVKPWDYVDYSEAWDAGSKIGEKFGAALDNFDLKKMLGFGDGYASEEGNGEYPGYDDNDTVEGIGSDVGKIAKAVNAGEEDLKYLIDMAEQRYVNNINLTSQTPVINITGQNTGNTAEDRRNLANTIRDILVEQVAAGSTRNTILA